MCILSVSIPMHARLSLLNAKYSSKEVLPIKLYIFGNFGISSFISESIRLLLPVIRIGTPSSFKLFNSKSLFFRG